MSVPNKDANECEQKSVEKVSSFRRILAQVIATTIKNLHMFDLGLTLAFPTIIIPSLTGISNDQNRNEFLSITSIQASWIVSIGFIFQTISGLVSGLVADVLGRKKAMIVANLPFAIGWLILWQANAIYLLFIGVLMLGLAVGLMEAAIITYHGEICEPSVRGTLVAFSNLFAGLGIFTVYLLNAWMAWRTVALVCLFVPITSTILLCFVPETPHWLLSKNRIKQAEKSLRWLRGWTSEQAIANEFQDLQRHSKNSKSCNLCIKQNVECSHPPPTLAEKCSELKRRSTLQPFIIVISMFFLVNFSGAPAMRSFIVQIIKAYESPISSDKNVVILGLVENLANVTFMCSVRFIGKRRIFLATIFGIFLSSLVISWYGFIHLPSGYMSFDLQNQTFHVENQNLTYLPTMCLYFWIFFSYCGFFSMPWMLLAEIFPFKSRGIASGIAAAWNNILSFISNKTYYNFENTLSLSGTSLFYCVMSLVGLISMYFILPETENRTLEEIERHFSDSSKKFTDRKIKKAISPSTQDLIVESTKL